jgi:hypothetical protein
MGVVFLKPLAALIALAALAPLALAVLRETRNGRLRRAIGVAGPRLAPRFATALAAAALVGCLAAAAAEPALRSEARSRTRTDAQVVFIMDVSRSMLARARPRAATRFERAVALAVRVRSALPEVPAGVASLSDWLLPHAFPTLDQRVFAASLARSVGVGRPAPYVKERNATFFGSLTGLGTGRYFDRGARHRLAIVLSDGESRRFSVETVARVLARARIDLLVVRFWNPTEAIYDGRKPVRGYVPDPLVTPRLDALAAATAGGRVYDERERGSIVQKARALLGRGPILTGTRHRRTVPLAPYVVLASVLPLGFLLARR